MFDYPYSIYGGHCTTCGIALIDVQAHEVWHALGNSLDTATANH